MKKLLAITVAAMTILSLQAAAQPTRKRTPAKGSERREMSAPGHSCRGEYGEMKGPMAPGGKRGAMADELKLTDSQRKEIAKLDEERSRRHDKQTHKQERLRDKQRKSMRKEFGRYDKQMKKILTDDQYSAWKAQRERRRPNAEGQTAMQCPCGKRQPMQMQGQRRGPEMNRPQGRSGGHNADRPERPGKPDRRIKPDGGSRPAPGGTSERDSGNEQ